MPPRARRGVGPATSLARKGRISRTIASTLEMAGTAPSQRRRTAAAASPARTRAPPQTRSQALPLHEPASASAAARHGDVAAGPGPQAPEAAVSARLPARGESSSEVFAALSATRQERSHANSVVPGIAGRAAMRTRPSHRPHARRSTHVPMRSPVSREPHGARGYRSLRKPAPTKFLAICWHVDVTSGVTL